MPPGTLIHLGAKVSEKIKISVLDYNETTVREKEVKQVEECFPFRDDPTVTWINVDGLSEVDVLERLGNHFGLHPLVMEDILNTGQRPKVEDFGDYIYIVLKMIYYNKQSTEIMTEQVSLILGKNFVISFQEEREGDVFDSLRERIRGGKGKIRKLGADYLAYSLLDSVVDNYFIVLENIAEQIEELEDELLKDPSSRTLSTIHGLKREIIFLRKSVWPLREVIAALEKSESHLFKKTTNAYLRDVYDHTIQVIDTVETFRDMLGSMMDIYLSSISNKLNEVMKVLTIIATIFIPLTFITSIYGMNFRYMPELQWRYGYFAVWAIVILAGAFMVYHFRKKRWL